MSVLPKAIQAQLDAADALQAQMTAPAPIEGTPEPVVTPVEPAPQPVEPAVQQPQAVQPQDAGEPWEQRFKVMEGKYRAEVPRLVEQNRELSDRLEQAINALNQANAPKPQDAPKLVTDADVEEYGAELVDMVRRVSQEQFNKLSTVFAAELDKRFGAVAQRVENTEQQVVKSAKDKFWDAVLKDHPDFDAVNNDARWVEFLGTLVPDTDFTRRAIAEDAVTRLNAPSLCKQLAAFKTALGLTTAPAPAAPAAPTPPAAKAKPNLSAHVAPDSNRSSAPTEPTARIWTGDEYAKALDHRSINTIGREAYELQVAEAEQAFVEGRVQF